MSKRVIAYAFFGGERRFPFDALIRANQALFPGWEMWIYHDSTALKLQGPLLRNYESQGLLKLMYAEENLEPCRSMLWRLKPLYENDVEYVISRDLDSLTLLRDRRMVEQFIHSGAAVHCINDNPQHNVPMMGGMVGFNVPKFRELTAFPFDRWEDLVACWNLSWKGADQNLMEHRVWPYAMQSLCEHRIQGYALTQGARFSTSEAPLTYLEDVHPTLQAHVQHPHWGMQCPLGDSFANYIGASGFRCDDALRVYNELMLPEIAVRIAKAESVVETLDKTPRVVMAADLDPVYNFFLPLTATLWQRLGFQPLFVLVGSEESWKANRAGAIVLEELRVLKVDIFFVAPIDGFKTSTVAQVSRLYSACFGLADDIYCLTSDADMWPLSTDFWHIDPNISMQHWGFAGNSSHFICYEGATVANWRSLMRLKSGESLQDALTFQLATGLGIGAEGMNAWCYDEVLLNHRIREWPLNSHSQYFARPLGIHCLPVGRVDRSNWSFDGKTDGWVDSHLVRPGYTDDNWSKCRQLYSAFLPNRTPWADDYRQRFNTAV